MNDCHPIEYKNIYFREMCSGSEAGSYVRRIDFVYHSTLGLRVIKKKKGGCTWSGLPQFKFPLYLPRAKVRACGSELGIRDPGFGFRVGYGFRI